LLDACEQAEKEQGGENLPPSGSTETLGIHFAHVTHANDANRGILHGSSHSGNESHLTYSAGKLCIGVVCG
jgi:hypothetical protein